MRKFKDFETELIDILNCEFYQFNRGLWTGRFDVQHRNPRARHNYQREANVHTSPVVIKYRGTPVCELTRKPNKRIKIFRVDAKYFPNTYLVTKILEKLMYYRYSDVQVERS
jgi:hypothetical protein